MTTTQEREATDVEAFAARAREWLSKNSPKSIAAEAGPMGPSHEMGSPEERDYVTFARLEQRDRRARHPRRERPRLRPLHPDAPRARHRRAEAVLDPRVDKDVPFRELKVGRVTTT